MNDRGGILDECRLLRLEGHWLLLTSPLARPKLLEHVQSAAAAFDVKVDDQTLKTGVIAVVGPKAPQILDAAVPEPLSGLSPGASRKPARCCWRGTSPCEAI